MEYKLDSKPWLTDEAIQFLDKFLKEAPKIVLELGSGGSTVWFAERAYNLISFEHDIRWYNRADSALRQVLSDSCFPTTHKVTSDKRYTMSVEALAKSD